MKTDTEILDEYIKKSFLVDPEDGVPRRGMRKYGKPNFTTWREIIEALYYTDSTLEAAERLHYGTTRGIGNSNSAIKGMEGSLGKKGDWQKWLGKNNTKPWNTHIKQVVGVNDCVVCKKRLPLSNFQQLYKDKYTSDVYRNECLDCHREKRKEWTRNYKQAHPDKIAAYGAKRRAKIAGSLVELSKEEQERVNLIYKERVRLNKEAGYIKYHVDHIKPLARGGKHSPDNLQILLKPDNLKKSWKWEEDDAR